MYFCVAFFPVCVPPQGAVGRSAVDISHCHPPRRVCHSQSPQGGVPARRTADDGQTALPSTLAEHAP